jgi:DNA-directed RNA polymerase specialized sigma24 family protein
MLTIPQVQNVVRNVAKRAAFPDTEELFSVALFKLANLKALRAENAEAFATTSIKNALIDYLRTVKRTEQLTSDSVYYTPDYTEELIESLCLTDMQAKVLRLRLEGYSDREIGDQCNLGRSRIQEIRSEIANIYISRN